MFKNWKSIATKTTATDGRVRILEKKEKTLEGVMRSEQKEKEERRMKR